MLKTMNFVLRIIQGATNEVYELCKGKDLIIVTHSMIGAVEAGVLEIPTVNVTLQTEMIGEKLKPQKFKDKMTEYENSANMCIKLVYVDNYDDNIDEYDNFKQIMKKYFSDYNDKWVLTCRCDNDDMLAKNYIEKMKENFRPVNNMFIDFIRGYNFDICNSDLNSYKCRSNHFIGYVEKFVSKEKLKLVYHCNHAFAKDYGYIRRINNKKYPLWCEIITGTNKLNELQGRSADSYELNYFNQYFVQKYN